MKYIAAIGVLMVTCVSLLWLPVARSAKKARNNDEAEIRELLERWAKAFAAKDLNGIMSIYEKSDDLVAYDIVAPLQYRGYEAYKKDYEKFLEQFEGPIQVEYRDMKIVAGDRVGFAFALERIAGTLKGGEKIDAWVRATEGYRKTKGRWLAIHDHISLPVDLNTGKALMELKP